MRSGSNRGMSRPHGQCGKYSRAQSSRWWVDISRVGYVIPLQPRGGANGLPCLLSFDCVLDWIESEAGLLVIVGCNPAKADGTLREWLSGRLVSRHAIDRLVSTSTLSLSRRSIGSRSARPVLDLVTKRRVLISREFGNNSSRQTLSARLSVRFR